MPSGKYLSDAEKVQINFLKRQGLSNKRIAVEIERSAKVVNNYLNKGDNYGKRPATKGNTKLSKRQKNQFLALASTEEHTVNEMIAILGLPIKKSHACKILNTSGHFKYTKRQKIPFLKPHHIEARMAWARKYMSWTTEWTNVVFSDEKKFNLDGPDGFQYYWHDLRKTPQFFKKRNFGGGSLMLWAGFSMQGRTHLIKCDGRMNSQKYINMLDTELINFTDEKMDGDFIFQQDNAAIHVSRQSRAWFEEMEIDLLDWPACSPDLNPIENLWGILARRVYGNGRQYGSVNELYVAVCTAWREIPQTVIDNLINSMPKRVFEVIKRNGKHLTN